MKKQKAKPERPVVTEFKIGDKVRVKHGVTDVDYPDMPLGGWAGTIAEIEDDGTYTVRWTQETLAAIHPVYKKRCERDDTVLEEYWLGDDDLEPDNGGPLDIQHPTVIKTKPLSPNDQDDRIRMIFGLTSNDPLPDVDYQTLRTYHKYLSKNLQFPFEAEYNTAANLGSASAISVKVIRLGDPDDELMTHDIYGILCEARHEDAEVTPLLGELEVKADEPNRQLVADYGYWFGSWR